MRTWREFRNFAWHRIRRHFSISEVAGLSKNMGKFWLDRWLSESEPESDCQIKKFPDPDLDSKILEQERSRKKWLRPPLQSTWC